MLGGVWAVRRPVGLRKLILAAAPASIPLILKRVQNLVALLPKDVRDTLEECHRNHDFDSDKYKNAVLVSYKKHLCRLDPWLQSLLETLEHLEEDPAVCRTM